MIVQPKTRGFICTTAHPDGCAANIREQIEYVKSQPRLENGPKKVLVLGSSTGYGLSSRIVPAFACGADTLGVFFEKEGTENKTASAGWYNTAGFEAAAKEAGLYARHFNGDAFSDEMKAKVISTIKADMGGQIDAVIYSLASPRRTDPKTGEVYKSCLKPIGETYVNNNLNTDKGEVTQVTIEGATPEEVAETVKVMGGEDWEMWMDALADAGVLADGVTTVAYSYIGPEMTWPVYKDGTIGAAKIDLEKACARIGKKLAASKNGRAYVSVNKAVVTQASSAIPVVPLYISILFKDMKARGIHEGCTEQIYRLFAESLCADSPKLDEAGRIRVDDWEMRDDVQAAVADAWGNINTENLNDLSDFSGYQADFLRLFGFGVEGIDYSAETDPVRPLDIAGG